MLNIPVSTSFDRIRSAENGSQPIHFGDDWIPKSY